MAENDNVGSATWVDIGVGKATSSTCKIEFANGQLF
jgi:hypothetical protein